MERSKGQSFGPETVRTPLNLEAPHLLPKPPHHRYLRKLQAQFLQVRNNSGAPADRAQAEGEEEMTSLLNARERKAAENLVMQYRVERAARWMGKFAIVVFGLALVAAVASLFTEKYL